MSKAAELAKWGEVSTNGQVSGRRNVVINGAMQVAQRGADAVAVGTASGYFTVDRFKVFQGATTDGRISMSQAAITDLGGFSKAMKFDVTDADTSIAAGELLQIGTMFEGQDIQGFKKGHSDAEGFTLSFYVKGTAKTYSVELFDADNTRHVTQTFNVTTSWNRIVLNFPADTTGAFDSDNALSLYILIWVHAGADYTEGTAATSWAGNVNANRAVGCGSLFSSDANELFITGVQLEVGSVATPFEHRSYGEELALCHRYCNALLKYGTGNQNDNRIYNADYANVHGFIRMGYPRMRDTPDINYTISAGAAETDYSSNGLIQLFNDSVTNWFIYDVLLEKEL